MSTGSVEGSAPSLEVEKPEALTPDERIAACEVEVERWSSDGFVAVVVMDQRDATAVDAFLAERAAQAPPVPAWQLLPGSGYTNRGPVLRALVDGEQQDFGKRFAHVVKMSVLVEVYEDGAAVCTGWKRYAAKTSANVALTRNLRVANLGGIPSSPELIIMESDSPWGFPTFRIKAAAGSATTVTIDALNLLATRSELAPTLDKHVSDQPEVFQVPPAAAPERSSNRPVRTRPKTKRTGPVVLGAADASSDRRPEPPAPRMVRDAAEAEAIAAEWVRWMGWPTAAVTAPGTDGGVDVHSTENGGVVAQVKFEAVKTGRPVLQALFGAGHALAATNWLFFSSAGYSPQAIEWADQVGMGLFRFTLDGAIEPVNAPARQRFQR